MWWKTVSPSRTIYLSGQLGMMPDGKFAGAPGDFRAQATQCFENLKAGLATAGATFEHVVKTTSYFIDISHLPIFLEVRDRYVNTKAPPASTAIQISKLAREPALFEIEAIAVVPAQVSGSRSPGFSAMKTRALFLVVALAAMASQVHAQDYPTRVITEFVAALGELSLLNA